jgi:hypothetical protein
MVMLRSPQCFGERLDRSPAQRAGLPPEIDVQARVERGTETHSPSLGHISY